MPTGHDFLSPRDFGAAIGISESTIKRWVDDGELQVMRTPGGHRRIALGEAVRFVRAHQCHIENPALLGIDSTIAIPKPSDDLAQQIHDALVAGDETLLRQRLLGAFVNGASLASLGDGPIRSAFTRIGELWNHSSDGIAIEHVAVQMMLHTLAIVRRMLPQAGPQAPLALGAAPAGDPYLLPTYLAELTLQENGWRTCNLGPDSPFAAIRSAMAKYRPRIVWLSMSVATPGFDHNTWLSDLASVCERTGVRLLIGGRVSEEIVPESLVCDRANSLVELASLAQTIIAHHRP